MASPSVGRLTPAGGQISRQPKLVDALSERFADAGSIPAASILVVVSTTCYEDARSGESTVAQPDAASFARRFVAMSSFYDTWADRYDWSTSDTADVPFYVGLA